ncbi:hypothetical protein NST77_23360 [Niallia sp. FSL W8-0177]|uniref:hypothetical protein n=1 Tax=Niallia sp. FSL W8-0177 TaxID=2954522 RepID=UPI0030F94F32
MTVSSQTLDDKFSNPIDIKAFLPYLFGKVLIEGYVDDYITEWLIIFMPTLPKYYNCFTQ